MKKVLTMSSMLLGLVFLAGCGQQPVSQTQPKMPAPVAQTPTQPVATQPVDETASWQAYTSAKSSFELKYPSGYKYVENNNYGEEPAFVIRKAGAKEGVYAFGIHVTTNFLGGDPDKFNNPDVWEKEQNKLGNSYTKTSVGGQTAYVPKYDTKNINEYIVFMKNGSVYDMYSIYSDKNDPAGEKILSTLKFTK